MRAAMTAAMLLGAIPLRGKIHVLTNFTLIDGSGRLPTANTGMVVDAGRITWIGPMARLKAPPGAQIVVMDPKSWTQKWPFLRWWAALKMKESQCPERVRVTHPA